MDIDLFLTPYGECGLLCNALFKNLPAGTIFDAETLELTFEFIDDAPFHFNITVEEQLRDRMLLARKLYVGFLQNGLVADTIEIPLLYLNDPYGSDFSTNTKLNPPTRSMIAFEQFMKRSNFAQPIHRQDLGDEDSNGSVLKGMNPKHLEFVPQLVRQRLLEAAPRSPAFGGPPMAPEPILPQPMGPGGMKGSNPARRRIQPSAKPSDQKDDE